METKNIGLTIEVEKTEFPKHFVIVPGTKKAAFVLDFALPEDRKIDDIGVLGSRRTPGPEGVRQEHYIQLNEEDFPAGEIEEAVITHLQSVFDKAQEQK